MITHETASRILGFPAAKVGELAGVTYRQVDHWTRQGYVTPSVNAAVGRGARRLFSADDVVRVAALGRFGKARLDIGLVGPLVAGPEPVTGDQLLVAHLEPLRLEVIAAADLRQALCRSGPCVVFDPAPVLHRLDPLAGARGQSSAAVEGAEADVDRRLRGVS